MPVTADAVTGSLLGTAVGDALGLPYEGLPRRRAAKLLGPATRHRFLLGRGMVSDDTDHACMVGQALVAAGGDPERFGRDLAWRLRLWLLALPAGIGLATLRAIVRLWLGASHATSGVPSAGSGPAMRTAILGAALDDPAALARFVRVSTHLTHREDSSRHGALAIALAAWMARRGEPVSGEGFLQRLSAWLGDETSALVPAVGSAARAADAGLSTRAFADSVGLAHGVSGYVCHSVPVAIHAWLSHPRDFRAAVTSVIECGGDTDTTAAMVGGIVGAAVGKDGIPAEWLEGLLEWPRSVPWMERLARQVAAAGGATSAPGLPVAGLVARNLFFLAVVLVHGFRRLAPPY